jgi:DNA-binding LacI/PurR family transcriptional regulator
MSIKKPNIYDVAKLAEVSHQTVSRVLNSQPNIRPATKARVEAAMATLGYQPNPAARSLVTAKSNMLGLLVADTGLYGPTGMLNAMERQARQAGYFAVTVAVRFDSPESWAEGIQHLSKMHVEGIASIALRSEVLAMAATVMPNVKMVAIDIDEHQKGIHSVGIDNEGGGYMATKHLIELGHKKILHISGPPTSSEAQSRLLGYQQAMHGAGLEPAVVQGDWTAETGFRLGVELNLELTGYTAVFTANDALALGLMKALRMRDIRVPQDISLVGFDDIPESPYFYPPLTTIRQDFNQLGEAAIELLLSDLAGTKRKKVESLKPTLIVRDSATRIPSNRKSSSK